MLLSFFIKNNQHQRIALPSLIPVCQVFPCFWLHLVRQLAFKFLDTEFVGETTSSKSVQCAGSCKARGGSVSKISSVLCEKLMLVRFMIAQCGKYQLNIVNIKIRKSL